MKPLIDHINEHHGGNHRLFAEAVGVTKQKVSEWKRAGWVITADGWVVNPNTSKRDISHIHRTS